MRKQWITFISSRGQQHRRPEVFQESQMGVPILYRIVENRANFRVHADLRVELLDDSRDLRFGYQSFRLHGRASSMQCLDAPDWIWHSASLLTTNACVVSTQSLCVWRFRRQPPLHQLHICSTKTQDLL